MNMSNHFRKSKTVLILLGVIAMFVESPVNVGVCLVVTLMVLQVLGLDRHPHRFTEKVSSYLTAILGLISFQFIALAIHHRLAASVVFFVAVVLHSAAFTIVTIRNAN